MIPISNIGKRIASFRKEKGYSQEQLAQILNITGQAVSKWETGNALPDTAILPGLARALETSIDQLLTGLDQFTETSPYDREYEKPEYYWGMQASTLAQQVTEIISPVASNNLRLLDIGSGEGRDAVFFARCGFIVDALEISLPGIEKIKQQIKKNHLSIKVVHANMIGYELVEHYDVIYSMGSLQFLPIQQRARHFENYKKHTRTGGLNAHMVFVKKPFIAVAPDWQKNEYFYCSGDLDGYYHDWEILHNGETIVDCRSANIPHQHAVSYIIARKVG